MSKTLGAASSTALSIACTILSNLRYLIPVLRPDLTLLTQIFKLIPILAFLAFGVLSGLRVKHERLSGGEKLHDIA